MQPDLFDYEIRIVWGSARVSRAGLGVLAEKNFS